MGQEASVYERVAAVFANGEAATDRELVETACGDKALSMNLGHEIGAGRMTPLGAILAIRRTRSNP